jgi:D-lactate dehydrogenase
VHPPDPALIRDLQGLLAPDRVLSRPLDLLARSVDASMYRLIPRVVVRPRDLDEVRALFAYCKARGRHLTLRTAGTSLSGQAITDDILVELAPHWRAFRVLDGGLRIWTQPGVVGGYLNRVLAPTGRRLGPDPASIDAAMMGGIVANNSSGMCCGVAQNSYRTLDALSVLLEDGTLVDTSRPDADDALRRARPGLHAALGSLRDEVRADAGLCERIRRRFSRKQTTGYSLNAFLDHETPVEILAHLMVGSEGTLGFVADVTLRTVPDPPARATALLFFGELQEAGAAVAPLAEAGAAALEIMDALSLRSQAGDRAFPFPLGERTAALLVEFREADDAALQAAVARGLRAVEKAPLLLPAAFSSEPREREEHWRLRKGLFTLVGGQRPSGTSVVMEDVAVPVDRLADAITDLQVLYVRHGFPEAVTFGHAKDGNLHFVFAGDFSDPPTVARYSAFMRELVDVVVGKYDGSLKAEHGSGRNMAPFVRDEWGDQAYALMHRVKALLDPAGILNPGVLLSDDPDAHVRHLKPLPTITPLADRCIECGFCEPRCPSRYLTVSPRQRIVIARELTRLSASADPGDRAWRDALAEDSVYESLETCARDGMCQTSCPVKIDTGAMVKEIMTAVQRPRDRRVARWAASRFGTAARLARWGLSAAHLADRIPGGRSLVRRLAGLAPAVELPGAAAPMPAVRESGGPAVVYFPSCLNRILGALPGEDGVSTPQAVVDACEAAGLRVVYPAGLDGLCCGMPFSSKSYTDAAKDVGRRTADALWEASAEGRDPVVTDASPCAGTLEDVTRILYEEKGRRLRTYDFPAFWAAEVLERLPAPPRRVGRAVLHPTCTLVKGGGLLALVQVARAHAEEVLLPPGAECCGFAGDRGFFYPELTASATARESAEVREWISTAPAGLYSTCRTCEIGMGRAVGRPYQSIAHLVRESMRRG